MLNFTGLGIPRQLFTSVANAIRQDNECSDVGLCKVRDLSKYPTFLFRIDDTSFAIKPENYMICSGDTLCDGCTTFTNGCFISVSDSGSNKWIFGDSFFASYYTLFDVSNKMIAFACDGPCDEAKTNWEDTSHYKYVDAGLS